MVLLSETSWRTSGRYPAHSLWHTPPPFVLLLQHTRTGSPANAQHDSWAILTLMALVSVFSCSATPWQMMAHNQLSGGCPAYDTVSAAAPATYCCLHVLGYACKACHAQNHASAVSQAWRLIVLHHSRLTSGDNCKANVSWSPIARLLSYLWSIAYKLLI